MLFLGTSYVLFAHSGGFVSTNITSTISNANLFSISTHDKVQVLEAVSLYSPNVDKARLCERQVQYHTACDQLACTARVQLSARASGERGQGSQLSGSAYVTINRRIKYSVYYSSVRHSSSCAHPALPTCVSADAIRFIFDRDSHIQCIPHHCARYEGE